MSPLTIIATLGAYIAMLFVVAWRSGRNSTNSTFFTGGRNTPRMVASIAMVGAAMSGVTYISVPGTVATDCFSYLQTCLGFIVGYIIIALVLIPLYYKLGVVSLYEYLDKRYGITTHRTGAWFFFISKILSASLRAYVICVVLQGILFERLNIPFAINAAIMMSLVALYTRRGGVKSVVWVELLKSIIMIGSLVATIAIIVGRMGLSVGDTASLIANSDYSHIFFFDDPMDTRYFWKQFLSGILLVVAMTGLDQDMMQTVLSCRNRRDAQRSMLSSICVQVVVITLFLSLGALLYTYANEQGIAIARGDELFGSVAIDGGLPMIVGVLFILGLVASTYSSAGSALTALTTSFTLDILRVSRNDNDNALQRTRSWVHTAVAAVMTLIILTFWHLSSDGAITLIFTLASYTYGPLVGLFIFGLATRRTLNERLTPIVAILAPAICYIITSHSEVWFAGYRFSYEVLILNALIMLLGLFLISLFSSKRNARK
jgi:Na+/proline symporter